MIAVQEAVRRAKTELMQIDPTEQLQDLRVEEVELAEEKSRKTWLVTLGFHRKKDISTFGAGLIPSPPKYVENRAYKTLRIDAVSGSFLGMKMREVAV